MTEEPQPAAETAPEGGAVVVTRHRDHRFPGRGRRITVRLDEEEFAAIVVAAGRAGLTPTGFVGAAALAAARGTATRYQHPSYRQERPPRPYGLRTRVPWRDTAGRPSHP